MRILLSAFACDPTAGSEEGIGWAWAYHLSRLGHEVCVLTNKSYRSAIEEHVSRHSLPRLRFEYIEVRHVPFWIPGGPGLYPYYFCWQWKAYFRAKELHRESHFQIVHHITYGVFRNPSYLYRLKDIKFIFGPVGGGERSPRALRVSMSTKDSFNELCRDFVNLIPRADPFWHSMLRHAARIAVKTEETRACLPEETRGRAVVTLENMMSIGPCLAGDHRTSSLKLIYAGRFLQWKGLHLAVRALALAIKSTKAEFTIIGRDSGKAKEEFRLREQAKNLNVEQFVHFLPWMPKSDVVGLFAAHDALLFPSLHDSGGTIVMEAIAHGTPIICLDLGGPAVTVTSVAPASCAHAREPRSR